MTLLQRLRKHIASMAPHQKDREQGKLLIEAANEIERLRSALRDIKYRAEQCSCASFPDACECSIAIVFMADAAQNQQPSSS